MKKGIVWFRNDLRIHDNQALSQALASSKEVHGIYFSEALVNSAKHRFLAESLLQLKKDLQAFAIPLVVIELPTGSLAEQSRLMNHVFTQLVTDQNYEALHLTGELNSFDQKIQAEALSQINPSLIQVFQQRSLLAVEDLPFRIEQLPRVFTDFRKKVEASFKVRPEHPSPELSFIPLTLDADQIFSNLGLSVIKLEKLVFSEPLVFDFKGGEAAALTRLHEYFEKTQAILTYKETRNGMNLKNDSTKFSPWLANGSLSPRRIYFELKKFEAQNGANESTGWLLFELLWRDYFKFLAAQIQERFFSPQGLQNNSPNFEKDKQVFDRWCQGESGVDFVDANMKELLQTGWMSNRGRQNVASFLAKDLNMDWTLGAEWFQKHLLDFDRESNWGNWLYLAGVGTDPRDRRFNIQRQAEMYDSNGAYRKKWLNQRFT